MAIGSDPIFDDDFNRPNSGSLGDGYTVDSSVVSVTTFGIVDNKAQLTATTAGGVQFAYINSALFGSADYRIRAGVGFQSGVPAGALLRLTNPGENLSGYFVCISGAGTEVQRYIAGGPTEVGAYQYHGAIDSDPMPLDFAYEIETIGDDVYISIYYADNGVDYALLRTVIDSGAGRITNSGTVAIAVQMSYNPSNLVTWDYLHVTGTAAGGDETAPEFDAGPTVSAVTSTTFSVGATSSESGTASLIATSAAASQPLDAAFDASTETATITAATPFSIPHTGETGGELRKAWVQLSDAADNRATASVTVLVPQVDFQTVVIGTPNTTADNRITASPDIASGDTVSWGNIQGTGAVVVNDDATFDAAEGVTAFDAYVGNLTDGWGTVATQSLTPDEASPSLSSATIGSAGTSLTLAFDEAVIIGAGGSAGFALDMTGGAATLTYSSGDGTAALIYTVSRTIYKAESGNLAYVQPGNGIEDEAGNDLASFSGFSIANDSAANHPPTDITLSKSSVRVDAGLNAVVGTLSATDADPGDSFTYTLVAGTGDTDNASFSISGNQLLCDDPGTLGVGVYSIRVQTSDGADTYAEAFSITVAEPGSNALTLTRNLTGPLCRPLTRSLAR